MDTTTSRHHGIIARILISRGRAVPSAVRAGWLQPRFRDQLPGTCTAAVLVTEVFRSIGTLRYYYYQNNSKSNQVTFCCPSVVTWYRNLYSRVPVTLLERVAVPQVLERLSGGKPVDIDWGQGGKLRLWPYRVALCRIPVQGEELDTLQLRCLQKQATKQERRGRAINPTKPPTASDGEDVLPHLSQTIARGGFVNWCPGAKRAP